MRASEIADQRESRRTGIDESLSGSRLSPTMSKLLWMREYSAAMTAANLCISSSCNVPSPDPVFNGRVLRLCDALAGRPAKRDATEADIA